MAIAQEIAFREKTKVVWKYMQYETSYLRNKRQCIFISLYMYLYSNKYKLSEKKSIVAPFGRRTLFWAQGEGTRVIQYFY